MRHARKLIGETLLSRLAHLNNLGVGTTRLIKDNNLDISRPALNTLIDHYNMIGPDSGLTKEAQKKVSASLFPLWLPNNEIAEQPQDWKYKDRFPFGKWEQ